MPHCLYIISSIIAQIHPAPTSQLPTMQEQWCSNKAILNDEHIYPPEVKSRGLDRECAVNVHTWLRCREKMIVMGTLTVTPLANARLGNCMLGEATLITSLILQCACQYPFIKVSLADLHLCASPSSLME